LIWAFSPGATPFRLRENDALKGHAW